MNSIFSYLSIIIALLSICQYGSAQQYYDPIIKEGARWLERLHHPISSGTNITTDYELNLTNIDTTINDEDYKVIQRLSRVLYSGIDQAPPSLDNLTSDTTAQYWASIREDDKRVYIYKHGSEHLVYDFNVDVGDSLSTDFFFSGGLITEVDTIVIEEISRKRFHIDNSFGDSLINYFIYEGIGSSFGLFPTASYPTQVELVCHSNFKTQEIYFLSDKYNQCYEMKKASVIATPEQSFVNESHRWTYTLLSLVSHNNIDSVTYEARFDGTQFIEGREYYEAFERIALDDDSDWMSMGFYRQEGPKVWFWDKYNSKDQLLYDFGLDNIGDTFTFPGDWIHNGMDLTLEVINIDSVILKNGAFRKRLTFSILNNEERGDTYWIEGIGSEDTPLFPFSLLDEDYDGGNRKLECFFSNEEHLLQQNPAGKCTYLIVDVGYVYFPPRQIRIFPNPIWKGEPINLTGDFDQDNSNIQISVYNALGQLVLKTTASSSQTSQLKYEFNSGLYYCKIETDRNMFYANFLVVDSGSHSVKIAGRSSLQSFMFYSLVCPTLAMM